MPRTLESRLVGLGLRAEHLPGVSEALGSITPQQNQNAAKQTETSRTHGFLRGPVRGSGGSLGEEQAARTV